MYGKGNRLATIAKTLNAAGVQAPEPPRTRKVRAWSPSAIREMIRNERYRGVCVWNRTRKERNPETGRNTSRPRPESDWVRVDVPEWRIVSEELWQQAHQQIGFVNQRFGNSRLGGMNRTEESRRYLFSGLLKCGICGGNMTIVGGGGLRGYTKYGCPSHRYRGVCDNALTIRRDRLEEQLLKGLTEKFLKPDVIDYAIQSFQRELNARLKTIQDEALMAAGSISDLQSKRSVFAAKAANLAEAIASMGYSPSLGVQLTQIERDIKTIDGKLASVNQPLDLAYSLEGVREFASAKLLDLRALVHADITAARTALAKHIAEIVLTPKQSPEGPVYEVSGDVDLFGGEQDVMLMVARDGIAQHYKRLAVPTDGVVLNPKQKLAA